MTDSLNMTQLMDWLEGRLAEREADAVAAAVQTDESLQATVTWLRAFLELSQSTILIEPPAELIRKATASFRAFAKGKRPSNWLQTLVGTLTSDSWQRPSLAGVRRTGLEAGPRQLIYTTNTADIVLNTQAGSDKEKFDLRGQVFPIDRADPASFTVQLLRQEREAALTYTNRIGKFTCTDLVAGIYTLIIRGDQAEIILADVELSA